MTEEQEIMQAAGHLVGALEPRLRKITQAKGGDATASFIALARPYLRAALSEMEGFEDSADKRQAPYTVSAQFWDMEDGQNGAERIAVADPETVHGLASALSLISQWIYEVHEGDELSESGQVAAVTSRLKTLRTCVTRGQGTGQFRVKYTANGVEHLCHAEVKREDS